MEDKVCFLLVSQQLCLFLQCKWGGKKGSQQHTLKLLEKECASEHVRWKKTKMNINAYHFKQPFFLSVLVFSLWQKIQLLLSCIKKPNY